MAADQYQLLSEIAKRLRLLECICKNTLSGGAVGSIIVEDYQPLDCDGNPVGDPISVMPVISVAKQDVAICNYQQVADAINEAGLYNVPIIEVVTTNWALSDNNDITKVHSISISVIGTSSADTIDLAIDGGTVATLPAGFSTTWKASTTLGVDYVISNVDGSANAIVTILKLV